jgi:hypothetical protein
MVTVEGLGPGAGLDHLDAFLAQPAAADLPLSLVGGNQEYAGVHGVAFVWTVRQPCEAAHRSQSIASSSSLPCDRRLF